MPMIDVTLQEGSLTSPAKASLMDALSEIVLKWEGLAGHEKAKRLAFAYVHEVRPENVFVGGEPSAEPYYRVQVTVPEGAIGEGDKPGLIRDVTEAVLRAEGREDTAENRSRVWCIIGYVSEGDWGGGGKVFPYRALRERLLRSKKPGAL